MTKNWLNVSLPEALRAHVDRRVASGDWATPSEYVRDLIRRDKESLLAAREALRKGKRRPRRLSKQARSGMAVMEELIAGRRAARKE
jgi:putative addiction module CopG family antidote